MEWWVERSYIANGRVNGLLPCITNGGKRLSIFCFFNISLIRLIQCAQLGRRCNMGSLQQTSRQMVRLLLGRVGLYFPLVRLDYTCSKKITVSSDIDFKDELKVKVKFIQLQYLHNSIYLHASKMHFVQMHLKRISLYMYS